jgi:hypothetical protein
VCDFFQAGVCLLIPFLLLSKKINIEIDFQITVINFFSKKYLNVHSKKSDAHIQFSLFCYLSLWWNNNQDVIIFWVILLSKIEF